MIPSTVSLLSHCLEATRTFFSLLMGLAPAAKRKILACNCGFWMSIENVRLGAFNICASQGGNSHVSRTTSMVLNESQVDHKPGARRVYYGVVMVDGSVYASAFVGLCLLEILHKIL